jgi:polysaccharide chain length determinant protein (PEP-CTERM system associated)
MIKNRELTTGDYRAMLRRRLTAILIPALLATLAGFLVSYGFPAKYTSQSLILVVGQKLQEGYTQPVITEDLTNRVATMQQQVLSRNRLRPMIERMGLAHDGKNVDDVANAIRQSVAIEPAFMEPSQMGAARDSRGFNVNYTAPNPKEAQQVCDEVTSMLLEENLKSREQVGQSTTESLKLQVEEAKRNLDEQDSKLAKFKKQYAGQLPGDSDKNMKILMALNTQLDAATQAVTRAQQDKAYTESLLAQQLSAGSASQGSANTEALQKQMSDLQSQLLQLQARYTPDHPDVVKTKADIAELQKKLNEVNAAARGGDPNAPASANEPSEIRQLRSHVRQYEDAISAGSREQKRLQDQIKTYQGRLALNPGVEEQYNQLMRDYDTAQKFHADLLAKSSLEMATDMEPGQQGGQMRLLNAASLPDTPSFPNRLVFAGGGLGAGLVLGLGIALWLELSDKAIRTEQDIEVGLGIPLLVSVPWVGAMESQNGNGKRPWGPGKPGSSDKEKATVGV